VAQLAEPAVLWNNKVLQRLGREGVALAASPTVPVG